MIKVDSLVKNFDGANVLNGITFDINKGEIFGIIGESGSGKSTLLRCLNRLIPYDSGEIIINGIDISKLNPKELLKFRENIGMIFQNFSLVKRLTVYENIALPLKIRNVDKKIIDKKVKELANIIGIESKLNDKPRNLSGGQQQRVAIARALVTEPDIILSDECTSALDPNTTKSILKLLEKLNKELKVTIVMVSHQFDVISQVCDRVLFLENGICSALDNPETLFLKGRNTLEDLIPKDDIYIPEYGKNFEVLIHIPDEGKLISEISGITENTLKIVDLKHYNFKNKLVIKFVFNSEEKYEQKIKIFLNTKNIYWREIYENR